MTKKKTASCTLLASVTGRRNRANKGRGVGGALVGAANSGGLLHSRSLQRGSISMITSMAWTNDSVTSISCT